ncbi:MAG: 16S rRNA (adenine(1518)-N(6)/adenine(1519)-N(6))-dimethyltransferase RsmA, partial [Pyrinomonadaceae bacterium]
MHSFTPHTPKKSLGQHFLVDEGISSKIIHAFAPRKSETVVEIGPGRGSLTTSLLERAGHVIAIEFDRHLIPFLRERFSTAKNFTLIETDALNVDYCRLAAESGTVRVIANLPYNISTAILQRLIQHRACITEMVLMLQAEVAERITAPAGSQNRGFLTVLVEAYCRAEKLFDVAPEAFHPVPKVWSSVVRLQS